MRSIDGEVPAIHPPNQAFRPRNVSGAIFCVRIIARQVKGDSKMGKNEKTKKPKPKYNVWQNTAYMLSVAWDTRRSVPLLVVLLDRKSTRLNSSHSRKSRMPSSA